MGYTSPIEFYSFDYFFIKIDVRIHDHEIVSWTFLVLGKKSKFSGKDHYQHIITFHLCQDLYLIYSCMNNSQIFPIYTTKGSLQNKVKIILFNHSINEHYLA